MALLNRLARVESRYGLESSGLTIAERIQILIQRFPLQEKRLKEISESYHDLYFARSPKVSSARALTKPVYRLPGLGRYLR